MCLPKHTYSEINKRILIYSSTFNFWKVCKKNYRINWKVEPDNSLIQSRWNGFAINLAAFIHNSTDITVLTFLASLKIVSIYSVYCLVSKGIKQLIESCLSGISHTIGQAYARKRLERAKSKTRYI